MKELLVFIFLPQILYSQNTKEDFKSKQTGDTYEIIIRKPADFDSTQSHHIVYFTDASINSGKFILSLKDETIKNCVLIGIAHKGDWSTKRKRDFIPSDAGGYNNASFGQASKFFLFMKEELIPYINRRFSNQKSKVFIGHSFGGLAALYLSLRENKLFDHYFAISPSVWANHNQLLEIEKKYAAKQIAYHSNLTLYTGSLEFLNKVLSSTRLYYNTLKKRNYKDLSINFEIAYGVNHYGIVPKIVPEIFRQLK